MKKFIKDAWTIYRRETAAQVNSTMAYIFIIVFSLLASALFMFLPPFFAFPRAEMTSFFGWLIPVLTVFAPAATMRVWAEERRENTIEMLLTFPISAWALVKGKYKAVMTFYLVALLCTWPIPVMLEVLGEPDWGPIIAGYLAALLLGGLFLAVGMFISAFCRDQVTSFVLSFLVCAGMALVGWDTFSDILDGSIPGLGAWLADMVGMTTHYLPMTRGVIGVTDLLYFAVWIVLLLFLNVVYLQGRGRPYVNVLFSGTVALCLVIGATFNVLISDIGMGRFDLTENKIYTVSDSTKKILGRLDIPVRVKVYITPSDKMPAELKDLENDVVDKLREMRLASGGMLNYEVLHMEAAEVLKPSTLEEEKEQEKEQKSLEERLMDKGIEPFTVQALRDDQSVTQLVYSAIGVAYRDREEEIIPQVVPQMLPDLEYRLMSIVYRLTREKPPVVALVAPVEEVNIPPQMMQFYLQSGRTPPRSEDRFSLLQRLLEHEKLDVRRVKLTRSEPLPDEFDALFVVNPRELNERQKWEINRALVEGKPCFIAAQRYRWNYSVQRDSISVSKIEDKPGINDVLEPNGLKLLKDILMDSNHAPIRMADPSNPLQAMLGGGLSVNFPMHVVIHPTSMNQEVSIVNNLGPLFCLWPSPLQINREKIKENKLEVTTLFTTSDEAWTVPAGRELTQADLDPPEETSRYPLAVMVKGQFKDAFAGKERPEWPEEPQQPGMPPPKDEEAPASPATPAPGTLILVGCSEMFSKSFIREGMDFFMNCTDILTLSEELVHIRAKKHVSRTIERPGRAARRFWQFMTLFLMAIVVAAAGIARTVLLRRSRERYRSAHQQEVG